MDSKIIFKIKNCHLAHISQNFYIFLKNKNCLPVSFYNWICVSCSRELYILLLFFYKIQIFVLFIFSNKVTLKRFFFPNWSMLVYFNEVLRAVLLYPIWPIIFRYKYNRIKFNFSTLINNILIRKASRVKNPFSI